MQKLYCYVDETGQDTKGDLFIVSVIVTEDEREKLSKQLEGIEKNSGKGKYFTSYPAGQITHYSKRDFMTS